MCVIYSRYIVGPYIINTPYTAGPTKAARYMCVADAGVSLSKRQNIMAKKRKTNIQNSHLVAGNQAFHVVRILVHEFLRLFWTAKQHDPSIARLNKRPSYGFNTQLQSEGINNIYHEWCTDVKDSCKTSEILHERTSRRTVSIAPPKVSCTALTQRMAELWLWGNIGDLQH